MRFALSLALCLVAFASVRAQDVRSIPLAEAEARGIAHLDSLYAPAVHSDASLAVFAGRDNDVLVAWRAFLGELAQHLRAEGFAWAEPLRGYHRFYFRPDGRVDRVLYHLRGVEDERLESYGRILEGFAETHRIELEADRAFSQCSPIKLMPPATPDEQDKPAANGQ